MSTAFLFKASVKVNGARPQLLRALATALEVWEMLHIPELVVTSINDGEHKQGSLHYKGFAADLRTHNIRELNIDADTVVAHLRAALGDDFDVLLEFVGEDREHIHLEYDSN
jgi:hypothetical protein